MDFTPIAVVVGPCIITFFLGILLERIKNRNQLALDIQGSCGNINATIVNTGRVSFAVQELRINFSKSALDDKEAGPPIQLSKKIVQWLRRKKKVLISKLLPQKIRRWYGKRVMLKMAETSKFMHYSFPKRGRVLTLAPGESEFIEISMEGITATLDFLDSDESPLMAYLSC